MDGATAACHAADGQGCSSARSRPRCRHPPRDHGPDSATDFTEGPPASGLRVWDRSQRFRHSVLRCNHAVLPEGRRVPSASHRCHGFKSEPWDTGGPLGNQTRDEQPASVGRPAAHGRPRAVTGTSTSTGLRLDVVAWDTIPLKNRRKNDRKEGDGRRREGAACSWVGGAHRLGPPNAPARPGLCFPVCVTDAAPLSRRSRSARRSSEQGRPTENLWGPREGHQALDCFLRQGNRRTKEIPASQTR